MTWVLSSATCPVAKTPTIRRDRPCRRTCEQDGSRSNPTSRIGSKRGDRRAVGRGCRGFVRKGTFCATSIVGSYGVVVSLAFLQTGNREGGHLADIDFICISVAHLPIVQHVAGDFRLWVGVPGKTYLCRVCGAKRGRYRAERDQ